MVLHNPSLARFEVAFSEYPEGVRSHSPRSRRVCQRILAGSCGEPIFGPLVRIGEAAEFGHAVGTKSVIRVSVPPIVAALGRLGSRETVLSNLVGGMKRCGCGPRRERPNTDQTLEKLAKTT